MVAMNSMNMGNTQRKSMAITANHGQGSLNPQKAFHNQRTSVDNQAATYSKDMNQQRSANASHRSSNSAVNNAISREKSAS